MGTQGRGAKKEEKKVSYAQNHLYGCERFRLPPHAFALFAFGSTSQAKNARKTSEGIGYERFGTYR